MKRISIGPHTIIEVELTPFGAHVLAEYMEAEDKRAGHPSPERARSSVRSGAIEMPLWEVLKIFGSRTVSSTRLPFESVTVMRSESREERDLHEVERRAAAAYEGLRNIAKALGISDDYKAPEQVINSVSMFCIYSPPRVPNAPGWWWLGDSPVKVFEKDGKLVAQSMNGRTKPISDAQPWRGPAIVDPRVRKQDDDSDIPF
jgi:hypothetical protein